MKRKLGALLILFALLAFAVAAVCELAREDAVAGSARLTAEGNENTSTFQEYRLRVPEMEYWRNRALIVGGVLLVLGVALVPSAKDTVIEGEDRRWHSRGEF
jgi:hypothetical protein